MNNKGRGPMGKGASIDKPKDFTVLGIEKAFSKYVNHVFDGIELEDYISFINRKPSENFKNLEIFRDYTVWCNSLTEVVNLSTKEHFKALSENIMSKWVHTSFNISAIELEINGGYRWFEGETEKQSLELFYLLSNWLKSIELS